MYIIQLGVNDNIKLSTIVQDFYNGTGDFVGISDTAQLKIEVVGDNFTVTEAIEGAGTATERLKYFNLGHSSDITKKCIVDFSKCNRISVTSSNDTEIVVFAGDNTIVENVALVATGAKTCTMFSGKNVKVSDSDLYITAIETAIGLEYYGTFVNTDISVTSTTSDAFCIRNNSSGITRITGGELFAYTGNSNAESVCLYVLANMTSNVLIADKVSCPIVARSGYYQTNTVKINSGYFALSNCVLGIAAVLYTTGEGKTETGTMVLSKVN